MAEIFPNLIEDINLKIRSENTKQDKFKETTLGTHYSQAAPIWKRRDNLETSQRKPACWIQQNSKMNDGQKTLSQLL